MKCIVKISIFGPEPDWVALDIGENTEKSEIGRDRGFGMNRFSARFLDFFQDGVDILDLDIQCDSGFTGDFGLFAEAAVRAVGGLEHGIIHLRDFPDIPSEDIGVKFPDFGEIGAWKLNMTEAVHNNSFRVGAYLKRFNNNFTSVYDGIIDNSHRIFL